MTYTPPQFKDIADTIRKREKTTGHSVFGPSQIHRILACPASLRETLRAPVRPASQAAKQGTMLHDVMESLLGMAMMTPETNHLYTKLSVDDASKVYDCVDFIRPMLNEYDRALVEKNVTLAPVGIPFISGTADVILYTPGSKSMEVIDWKFGAFPVFVENNPQLKCYALGALLSVSEAPPEQVVTWVAQPALGYFKDYTYSAEELMDFAEELKDAVQKALSVDAAYGPGRKQCKFCAAEMTCRHRMEKALQDAKHVFDTAKVIQEAPHVAREEWADVLETLQEVEAVARDIRAFFHNEIWEGNKVPGYKLVHGRGSRKFKNEQKAILWLDQHYNLPPGSLFTTKPKSVAQIEKIIKGIKKDPDFKNLIEVKPGAPQLVKDDDKREAISAATTFAGV